MQGQINPPVHQKYTKKYNKFKEDLQNGEKPVYHPYNLPAYEK